MKKIVVSTLALLILVSCSATEVKIVYVGAWIFLVGAALVSVYIIYLIITRKSWAGVRLLSSSLCGGLLAFIVITLINLFSPSQDLSNQLSPPLQGETISRWENSEIPGWLAALDDTNTLAQSFNNGENWIVTPLRQVRENFFIPQSSSKDYDASDTEWEQRYQKYLKESEDDPQRLAAMKDSHPNAEHYKQAGIEYFLVGGDKLFVGSGVTFFRMLEGEEFGGTIFIRKK